MPLTSHNREGVNFQCIHSLTVMTCLSNPRCRAKAQTLKLMRDKAIASIHMCLL
jgi:hypothetical protein